MKALIVSVLASLVRIAGVEHMRLAIHRYTMALLLGSVALIVALVAICYALGGIWFLLLPRVGPVGAYLIVAGGLTLISGGCAFAAVSALRGKPPPPARSTLPVLPNLHGGSFSNTGITGLASAAVAGFIVGLVRGRK